MKKTIMSILTVWIMVSSVFVGLVGFSDIKNVKAPYTTHDPIRINSDAEFASMAGLEGWDGDGSPGNPYIIEGYDINGSGYGYCIYIGNTTVYFKINNSYLHEASGVGSYPYYWDTSIILNNVQNGTIANITADSNKRYGIYLDSSTNNTIANNNASNNLDGIRLHSSNSNIIGNNNASSNKDYGIILWLSCNNTITNNNAMNFWNGIYLDYSNSNTISDNNACSNNFSGICLEFSNSNTITNNTASNNHWGGISLVWSSNNTITNNAASSNNASSIYLSHSSNNTINSNMASSNIRDGIRLDKSNNNTIINNTASSNNNDGITFYGSSNNTIVNNNVSLNNRSGIYLKSSLKFSNSNTIITNNISFNNLYGIWIPDSESLDNRIYHNNIIRNKYQAYDDTNNGNQWDNGYPSGGNYWSDFDEPSEGAYNDYTGPDQNVLGRDNIVDNGTVGGGGKNPYIIDSDSQDVYPLISPIGNLTFLYEGWNLVSIPFIQPDTDLSKVLESIKGSFDTVEWYNASDDSDYWKINNTFKLDIQNDLDNIDHTMGFWIHITEPGGVLFEYLGVQPTENQTITLQPGWNMVGYPSIKNYNRTAGLNNLTFGTHIDSIWTYNAATQRWDEIGPSDYFEVGKGYWVHTKTKCEWEIPL